MTQQVVLHEKRHMAWWITLNRPEKRNALNAAMLAGISAGLTRAAEDREARAIVLTAAGDKAFCAGGDLAPHGGFDFDFAQPQTPYGNLLRQARACPLPIIVVVNGMCLAGGMGLLAMADLAIAADHARFGLPEVKMGLFPMQVLSLLNELVAPRILQQWVLTGESFGAAEAQAAGLLNAVVPQDRLPASAETLLAQLSACSPAALRRGKYAMRALRGMNFEQAISFAEGQLGLMTLTEDAREGLAAFNEKRPPRFSGK